MTTRLTAITLVLLLAGCVSHRPTPARYSLDALADPSEPGVKLHATIAIPEVIAPSWLRTEAMIYRLDYHAAPQPISYARAAWQAPPGEMLTMRLRHLISAVNSGFTLSRLDREADGYKLSVSLESFLQVFSQPHESRCVVQMIATLTGPGGQLLGQRTFDAERAAPSGNAAGGVQGLIQASDGALEQIVTKGPERIVIRRVCRKALTSWAPISTAARRTPSCRMAAAAHARCSLRS